MKSHKSSFAFHPFKDMKALLEARRLCPSEKQPLFAAEEITAENPDQEKELFQEAVRDVMPIKKERSYERTAESKVPVSPRSNQDSATLSQLDRLVKSGSGFVISDTPEYIEGTGYNVSSLFAQRLHQGDFSIQAYVDLHGLIVPEAMDVFDRFLRWAVTAGKRTVLIVHGRGLSSPADPVLKNKVVEWLTCRAWRKWVIAYASARSCDGGTGATYVLLRRHPLAKRFRKKG